MNLTELQRCKNNVNSRNISIKLVAKSLKLSAIIVRGWGG